MTSQSTERVGTWSGADDGGVDSAPPGASPTRDDAAAEGHADNFPRTSVGSISDAAVAEAPTAASHRESDATGPTDEDILLQQNIIRAEESNKLPMVGVKESLSSLKAEYAAGSQVFVHKIESLEGSYSAIRRTRGDGNCFFRSYIYSYLEGLVERSDLAGAVRFAERLQGWKQKLPAAGFEELTWDDAMDLLLQMVHQIGSGKEPLTQETLEVNFRDDVVSNMTVMLLRMITSAEIQQRKDFFAPFIMGLYDDVVVEVDTFCRKFVEPMGEESDHIHIVALCDALQVPVRVLYLDNSGAMMLQQGSSLEVNSHDFVPRQEASDDSTQGPQQHGGSPNVHLLYRPGHYDVMYPY